MHLNLFKGSFKEHMIIYVDHFSIRENRRNILIFWPSWPYRPLTSVNHEYIFKISFPQYIIWLTLAKEINNNNKRKDPNIFSSC